MSFRLIPAGFSEDLSDFSAFCRPLASLSCSFGRLPASPVDLHGGYLVIGGQPLLSCLDSLVETCRSCRAGGLVLGFSSSGELQPLCRALHQAGLRTVVPEAHWESSLQSACLVSSCISGGTLRARLSEAKALYGTVVLDLERMCRRFPLPCPDGCGTPASAFELTALREASFFSEELFCRAILSDRGEQSFCCLFDDRETLCRKLSLAEALGICEGFALTSEWKANELREFMQ